MEKEAKAGAEGRAAWAKFEDGEDDNQKEEEIQKKIRNLNILKGGGYYESSQKQIWAYFSTHFVLLW